MSSDLIPGFSALGMRVPSDDRPGFEKLLKSLWAIGQPYQTVSGECNAASGAGFRVWTRISDEGFDQVLEVPDEPGMLAHVEAIAGSDLLRVWFRDATCPEETEPIFPALVRSPSPWFPGAVTPGTDPQPFALTLLGREAGFFPDQASLNAHPDFAKFASKAIIPSGLFVTGDEQPRAALYVIGEVSSCVRNRNELTDDEFITLRVESLGGSLTVALPVEAVQTDVTGWIIVVEGLATGPFPASIPDPMPAVDPGRPAIDPDRVESELRRLTVEYFNGPGFDAYFNDIHVDGFTRFLCLVFGIFSKAARAMPKQRGKATKKLSARYRKAAKSAPIVMARLVMANTLLLHEGKASPALVVVAVGEGADDAMDHARRILARIHFNPPADERERILAKEIEDETYRFGKRRRLPEWLVGNVEAYAADLWVPAAAVAGGELFGEWLPCLAEPGPNGLTAAIPTELVTRAINRVSGPPPVPPKS